MTRSALRPDEHESYVAGRFDALHHRFKPAVSRNDVRLQALLDRLGPLEGLRVLDLGCGKGRFAVRLEAMGAQVVGVDLSHAMLSQAAPLPRLRASARRLPFGDASFDAVVAVEVFEHLEALGPVIAEVRRVLRPGGRLAVIDKNAGSFNSRRPWLPNLVVKWIDEQRGLWMYPAHGPVRERWIWPRALRRRLGERFEDVTTDFLLSADEPRLLFHAVAGVRRMVLWTARVPGGDRE
ncbi:MAG: class I SAM-dependent methyltransferase [Isosphaeraceae bacterium]